MRYLILTLLGLAVVPFVTVASLGPSAPTSAVVLASTHIVNEPIVIYSVSGSTLAGLVKRRANSKRFRSPPESECTGCRELSGEKRKSAR